MPLIKGKSPEAFKHNIKAEVKAGKPLKQSLAIAYSMKKKAKKMADGGSVGPTLGSIINYPGSSTTAPSKPKGYAEGGEVEQEEHDPEYDQYRLMARSEEPHEMEMENQIHDMNKHGLVDRIMAKRQMMSEGGKVANDTPITAGFDSNDFDDLVHRDDLESTYGDDDNAGDELGNAQEDHDRSDIIARIMRSRAKKDRMPRPA